MLLPRATELRVGGARAEREVWLTSKDEAKYPAPVRATGSNHSTAPCASAEGGTLLRMKMNRIQIDADTITVEAPFARGQAGAAKRRLA